MALFSILREIGDFFADLSYDIVYTADRIDGIYLIGAYLSDPLRDMGIYLLRIGTKFYSAATAWRDIWDDIGRGVQLPDWVSDLARYADDLISFIRDADSWIEGVIRRYYPLGLRILRDPVGEILEIIETRTGLTVDFLYNPITAIRTIVNQAIGQLQQIAQDPDGWLIRKIQNTFPYAWRFLEDPDGWLVNQIRQILPDVSEFARDPDGYIVEHFIAFLEKVTDRYETRLVKIAESILNRIF